MHSVVYSESVWVNFQQESMTLCSLHVFFFYHSQLTQNLFNNLAQLKITSPFAGVNGLSFYGLQVALKFTQFLCHLARGIFAGSCTNPGRVCIIYLGIMTTCKTCIMGTL